MDYAIILALFNIFSGIEAVRMKNILKWIAIIFVGFIVIGAIFGNDSSQTVTTDTRLDKSLAEQPVIADDSENMQTNIVDTVQEKAEPEGLSRPQKNAVRSAEQYISMTGFSRDRLIEQLSSDGGEGYTVDQATYGAQQAGACS